MTSTGFDPKSDFALPVTTFTTRLLADGIDEDTHAHIRNLHAGMIVLEKHMPWPEDVTEEEKTQELLARIKNYRHDNETSIDWDLRNDLEDVVPAKIDDEKDIIDVELADACNTIDKGKTTLNERVSIAILEKFLPKKTVNLCLQTRAALQLMAINNTPDKCHDITPPIIQKKPKSLYMVQDVLSKVCENYLFPVLAQKEPKYHATRSMPASRVVSIMALGDAQNKFQKIDQRKASKYILKSIILEADTVEEQYAYEESYQRYFDALNPSKVRPASESQKIFLASLKEKKYEQKHQKFAYENFHLQEDEFIQSLLKIDNTSSIDEETKEACQEIHAGTKMLAIYHTWHGYQDLQPIEINEEKLDHAQKAQSSVNIMIEQVIPAMKEVTQETEITKDIIVKAHKFSTQKYYIYAMAYESLAHGFDTLKQKGYESQTKHIKVLADKEAFAGNFEHKNFNRAYEYVLSLIPHDNVQSENSPK